MKQLGAQKGGDKTVYSVTDGSPMSIGDDAAIPEGYSATAPTSATSASQGGRRHRRHSKHHSKHHKKNSWLAHVKATMKLNRGKSFKQVLKLAKKSYKKSQSQSGGKKKRLTQSNPQHGGSGHASSSTFGANAGAYPN